MPGLSPDELSTAAQRSSDPILSHSDRFDPQRMAAYRAIAEYAAEHGVSFERALNEVSGR